MKLTPLKVFVPLTAAALVAAGIASGQSVVPPLLANVGVADVIGPVLVNGNPSVPSHYVALGQVGGTLSYVDAGTLVTTNTLTFANGEVNLVAHAAGTLAAIGLTTEPNPTDGKRECFTMDAIVTTLTWTANTGQTIGNVGAAATLANVPRCIVYEAASATWHISA